MVQLACCALALLAAGVARTDLVLDLGEVDRAFRIEDGGAWTTVRLDRGPVRVDLESREFLLRFEDGTTLTAADCPAVHLEALPPETGEHGLAIVYESGRFRVRVQYAGNANQAFATKQVAVEFLGDAEPPALLSAELEHWTGEFKGGGRGRPAFGESLMACLDHPASVQLIAPGALTLRHDEVLRARRESPSSAYRYPALPRVVFGVALASRSPADVFREALQHLRRHPRREVVHRLGSRAEPLSLEAVRLELDAVGRSWVSGREQRLHGLLLEDGWSTGALQPDAAVFPGGLRPLWDTLRQRRIGLGLGLPFDGDEWSGLPDGNELLTDSTHRRTVLLALMERLRETPPSHVLHRFGELPDDAPATAVQHVRDWLGAERRFAPELTAWFESPSDSPWWLLDFEGRRETLPAPDPTVSVDPFQDAVTREDLRVWQRMQTGWLAEALLIEVDGDGPGDAAEWSDLWMLRAGRGLPVLRLPDGATRWPAELATALGTIWNWANDRKAVLGRPAVWFGGRPDRGEVYGYLHQLDGRAILVLRNPGPAAARVELPVRQPDWLQTYPCIRTREGGADFVVEGHGVVCLETSNLVEGLAEVPGGVRFKVGDTLARLSQFDLLLAAGETARFAWRDLSTGETVGTGAAALSPAAGRRPRGETSEPATLTTAVEDRDLVVHLSDTWCYRGESTVLWLDLSSDRLAEGAGGALECNAPCSTSVAAGVGWRRWRVELRDSPPDGNLELRLHTRGAWPRPGALDLRVVVRRTEHLEAARVGRAHALRSRRTPSLPPMLRAGERVQSWVAWEGPLAADVEQAGVLSAEPVGNR